MEIYSVDMDPEQVVRWLMVEQRRGSSGLRIEAWRGNEVHPLMDGSAVPLADEDLDDLQDKRAVAILDVSPVRDEGWHLSISVSEEFTTGDEDEAQSTETAEDGEPISLEDFYADFLRPGRSTAIIAAEIDGPTGEEHLDRFLASIEANVHAA
jgi:hypothetical protein